MSDGRWSDGAVEERVGAAEGAAADECWEWEGRGDSPVGRDQDCASCSLPLTRSGVLDPLLHAGVCACRSADAAWTVVGGVGGADAGAEMRMDGMPRKAGLVPGCRVAVGGAVAGKEAVTALVPVDELWAVAAHSTGDAAAAKAPATPAATPAAAAASAVAASAPATPAAAAAVAASAFAVSAAATPTVAAAAPAASLPAAGADALLLPADADPAVPPDDRPTRATIAAAGGGPAGLSSGGATCAPGGPLPPGWVGGPLRHSRNRLPAPWACAYACCSLAPIPWRGSRQAPLPCRARSRSDASLAAWDVASRSHSWTVRLSREASRSRSWAVRLSREASRFRSWAVRLSEGGFAGGGAVPVCLNATGTLRSCTGCTTGAFVMSGAGHAETRSQRHAAGRMEGV